MWGEEIVGNVCEVVGCTWGRTLALAESARRKKQHPFCKVYVTLYVVGTLV